MKIFTTSMRLDFRMSLISTAKVICGSEIRENKAKELQPGDREWET